MHFVYTLADPRDGNVKYVGMTNDITRRYKSHITGSLFDNENKTTWMSEIKQEGKLPILNIVETVDSEDDARVRELHWIQHYKAQGILLVNAQFVKPYTPTGSMKQKNKNFNELGKQIESVRESRSDYSLYRLAKDAKMDYSYLYRLMHGNKHTPSKEKLFAICRALRCSLQEAAEIFNTAGYLAPTPEELQDEAEEKPAMVA